MMIQLKKGGGEEGAQTEMKATKIQEIYDETQKFKFKIKVQTA